MTAGTMLVALVLALAFAAPAFAVEKGTAKAPDGTEMRRGASIRTASAGVGKSISGATPLSFGAGSRAIAANGTLTSSAFGGYAEDDVYKVWLFAGESAVVSLDADAWTDFGLFVYGPDATDIFSSSYIAAAWPYYYGGPDSYPLTVSFTAATTGWYYVDAASWIEPAYGDDAGSGAYMLDVSLDSAHTQTLMSPQVTQSYNTTAVISGVVSSRIVGEITDGVVLLSYSLDGVYYTPLMVGDVEGGAFSFTSILPGVANVYYQAQYLGSPSFGPSVGRTVATRYAALTGATARRVGTRTYTMTGYTWPEHAAGSGAVRVYLWKQVLGKWKAAGSVLSTCSGTGGVSMWSARKRFSTTGKYRMRSLHMDADHVATWGPYSYVTVK